MRRIPVLPSAPMATTTVRTRFAPSPTGALHPGNARTALFAWLHARGQGGTFVIRCEDTDAERSEVPHLDALLEMLRWFGLDWDEGPDVGGDFGPYHQSGRGDLYRDYLRRLLREDRAYPCFCTREELAEARRRQVAAGQPPRYPGTCAGLGEEERAARRAEGREPVLRLRVPAGGDIRFDDLVHGPQRAEPATIGDFVIARGDDSPTFLFANAVDDALMRISHVLRGEDHLANTPRQLLLLDALGLPAPLYGHLPLVLGVEGRPLSKREGAVSLADLRDAGYLPLALMNHLARIGFTPGTDELLAPRELTARFDFAHVGRAAARHDPQALEHWQKLAVEALDDAALWNWLQAHRPVDATEPPVAGEMFAAAVRPNVHLPADGWYWAQRLFAAGAAPDEQAAAEIDAAGPDFFEAAAAVDTPAPVDDFRAWAQAVGERTGNRGRTLYRPLRAALTGTLAGPELHAVVPLMPPDLVRQRLQRAAGR